MDKLINNVTDSFYDIVILDCVKDVAEIRKEPRREQIRKKLEEIKDWEGQKIYKLSKSVALGSADRKKSLERSLETIMDLIRDAQQEIGEPNGTMKVDVFTHETLKEIASELWRNVGLFDTEGTTPEIIEKSN